MRTSAMDARGEAPSPDEREESLDGLGSSATGGGRDIDRILHDRIGHVHTTCRGTQEFDVADGNGVTGERVLVYGIGAAYLVSMASMRCSSCSVG